MTWEEIVLSEEKIELFPGEHWLLATEAEGQWVEMAVPYPPDPLEGPDPNFTNRPLDEHETLYYAISEGWAAVAVRLNALAEAYGGKPNCAWQEGSRYFYQFTEAVRAH